MSDWKKEQEFLKRAEGRGSVLGLESIRALLARLNNPQDKLKIIHVAGTNGKGSTCAYLRNILSKAGYRVGMYTSPAVFCFEERFTVDGEDISMEEYYSYVARVRTECQELERISGIVPTLFEIETAIAFLYFYEKGCDPVIMEVGMGGATDATNVISRNLCSVFTSIGRDHMQFLGDSLESIAAVKAGIMKAGGTAVSIWQDQTVADVLIKKAQDMQAELYFAKPEDVRWELEHPFIISYREFSHIEIPMEGSFQRDNCVLALETVSRIKELGYAIPDEAVAEGIKTTKWPGRMEKISSNPRMYLDGAHNVPAAMRLKETLEKDFTNKTITFIIGVLADKEHKEMLSLVLPYAADIITVTPDNARAMRAVNLADEIRNLGYEACESVSFSDAIAKAVEKENEMILAFGSLSYLKDIKKSMLQWKKEHGNV